MKKKLLDMFALLIALVMVFASVTAYAAPEGEAVEGEAIAAEGESGEDAEDLPELQYEEDNTEDFSESLYEEDNTEDFSEPLYEEENAEESSDLQYEEEEIEDDSEPRYEDEIQTVEPLQAGDLENGMTSTDVYELQELLLQIGYYGYVPDGSFGWYTESCVRQFQEDYGLYVDGVAGNITMNALRQAAAAAASETAPADTSGSTDLQRGMVGTAVLELQTLLKEVGYYEYDMDGSFGGLTEECLRDYQRDQGLYVDGVAGPITLAVLREHAEAVRPKPIIQVPMVLSQGMTGDEVLLLQDRLNTLGYSVYQDGEYGGQTAYAVKKFQMYNALSVTGTVDETTLSFLNSTDAVFFHEINPGDNDRSVTGLQNVLLGLGYIDFVPDGDFGTVTQKAVKMFQRENGLQVDSMIGAFTLEKLLLDPIPYDPSMDPIKTEAEQMAEDILDQVGWNLYSAYRWSVNIPYRPVYTGVTVSDAAIYGFTYWSGNCVAKAATFCMLARALGYSCNVIYGYVPYVDGSYGDHAWCEIWYNGSTYVCDPDFESDEGYNGYMIYYGQSGTWQYIYDFTLSD